MSKFLLFTKTVLIILLLFGTSIGEKQPFEQLYTSGEEFVIWDANKITFTSINENEFVVATIPYLCTNSIYLFYFNKYEFFKLDSIKTPLANGRFESFTISPSGNEHLTAYWSINNLDDFNGEKLYICSLYPQIGQPCQIYEYSKEAIYSSIIYTAPISNKICYFYEKPADPHFYLRIDNLNVSYSKDFLRMINNSVVGSEIKLHSGGAFNIYDPQYLITSTGEYSLYSIRYEGKNDSLRLLLENFKDWKSEKTYSVSTKCIDPDSFQFYSELKLVPFRDGGICSWNDYINNRYSPKFVKFDKNYNLSKPYTINDYSHILDIMSIDTNRVGFLLNGGLAIFDFNANSFNNFDCEYLKNAFASFVPGKVEDSNIYVAVAEYIKISKQIKFRLLKIPKQL